MSKNTKTSELTKRVYDTRVFSVDVSRKLRDGDAVTSFTDVLSQAVDTDLSPTNLTVTVPGDNEYEKITDGRTLNFYCGGGQSGITYEVALRYVSTSETQLESVIRVRVV